MKTRILLSLLFTASLAGVAPIPAQTAEDLITTTGLSTLGTDGHPWAYVTWDTSTMGPLKGHTMAVYVKPGKPTDGGVFTRQAIVKPATDPNLIRSHLVRGACLGESLDLLDTLVNDSLRAFQEPLPGTDPIEYPALPATPEERLAALLTRPEIDVQEQLFPILHLLSPTASMALGQAWAGELPVGPGAEATIEVRDFDPTTQTDRSVIGRVTVIAAQHTALPAAGAPVQLPDHTVTGDLNIRLRWAMPATLLRRQMQLKGFELWRVEKALCETLNWHITPPTADALQLNLGPQVRSLLPVPRRESETYTDLNVADFVTDPETYFHGDDNDRYKQGGVPFNDADEFYYFTVAIDLLGRPGGVSPGGLMLACRTLPPPAPQRLAVVHRTNDVATGAEAGQRVIELSWTPNTDTVLDQTHSYEILRATSASAFTLPEPTAPHPPGVPIPYPIIPIGTVSQSTGDQITFIDDTLTPTDGESFWYSVRAVHDGPLGEICSAFASPVPALLQDFTPAIAPSPAETVAAGFCSRVLLEHDSTTVIPAQGSPPRTAIFQITRASTDVAWVEVRRFAPSVGPTQRYYFAEGETVAVMFFTIPSDGADPLPMYDLALRAGSKGGTIGPVPEPVVSVNGVLADDKSTLFQFTADVLDASRMSYDYLPARQLLGPGLNIQNLTEAGGDEGSLTGTVTGLANGDDVLITKTVGEFGTEDAGIARVFQGRVAFSGETGESYVARKINGGDSNACGQNFHNIRVEGTTKVNPIRLGFITGLGVREFRVYRQVDSGELTMVKQGELPGTAGTVVTLHDVGLPPNSASLCYFVQTFDVDGNSSNLQRLGECVQTVAPLPRPVIGQPEFLGTPSNPRVKIRWTSATEGVENFEINLHPIEGANVTLAQAGFGILTYTRARNANLSTRAFDPILQMPVAEPAISHLPVKNAATGAIETSKVPQDSIFISPFIGSGPNALGTGPLFSQEFDIAPGVEYQASIVALGPSNPGGQARSEASSLITFRYTPPPPPPSEDCIMPWPYRDLPPVVTFNPDILARRFVPATGETTTNVQDEHPVWPFNHDAYPVGVRIGRIGLLTAGLSGDYGGRLLGSTTPGDASDDFLEFRPTGFENSLRSDPNDHVFHGLADGGSEGEFLLPVVLYRIQVPSTTYPEVSDVVVQCSPKINLIAYENISTEFRRLRDPYIGVTGVGLDPIGLVQTIPKLLPVPDQSEINPDNTYAHLNLYLLDTKPVINGAKYRYWMVRFLDNGEPASVIDAGDVEIPAS